MLSVACDLLCGQNREFGGFRAPVNLESVSAGLCRALSVPVHSLIMASHKTLSLSLRAAESEPAPGGVHCACKTMRPSVRLSVRLSVCLLASGRTCRARFLMARLLARALGHGARSAGHLRSNESEAEPTGEIISGARSAAGGELAASDSKAFVSARGFAVLPVEAT